MKIVILLSGGMDSITSLYHACRRYTNSEVIALIFNYGSKSNDKEIDFSRYHCDRLNVKYSIFLFPVYSFQSKSLNIVNNYGVAFSNGIRLSFAAGYADNIGAKVVMLGGHKSDFNFTLDYKEEFVNSMCKSIELGTNNKISIIYLFKKITNSHLIKIGLNLGVDYSKTWSCLSFKERPCLTCEKCKERINGFWLNDIKDPILTMDEWDRSKRQCISNF